MNLLSATCTVLRLHPDTGILIHAPLDASGGVGFDLSLNLHGPLGEPVGIAGQPGVMIEPTIHPRLVHIARGQQDLWADARSDMAVFRDRHEGRFTFLLVDEVQLAHLRVLFSHRWVRGLACDGPEMTITATFPFMLDLGLSSLDLCQNTLRPLPAQIGYVLDAKAGEITITSAGPARAEIELRKRGDRQHPVEVTTQAALHRGPDCGLHIECAEEFSSLPITVCDADRDWMYKNPYGGEDQLIGRRRCRPLVVHGRDKYVLMSRHVEGVIFDEQSILNEDGYLEGYGYRNAKRMFDLPEGIRQEDGRLFIDRDALADAPVIEGPAIVFVIGNLSNYTHWLIDGLLALHVLLDHVPRGATLVLPATLRALRGASRRVIDHRDTLRVFGLDHLPAVEIAHPYCKLQQAYWLAGTAIFNIGGEQIQGLRARMAALRPPPPVRTGRIYIARRLHRGIANAEALAPFLERQGFTTRYLEDCSFEEQVDMFSTAEWVIGPHGSELGNLLFCQPGTKVLELAPDFDYKPYFSYMANKLNLAHGILPCPTTDASFNGNLIVDMPKFAALFRMLKNRL